MDIHLMTADDWRFIRESLHDMNLRLTRIETKETEMANTLQQVLDAVRTQTTDVEGLRALIDNLATLTENLRTRVNDFLQGQLTPDQQAQLDAMFDQVRQQHDDIASEAAAVQAAIDENTPDPGVLNPPQAPAGTPQARADAGLPGAEHPSNAPKHRPKR